MPCHTDISASDEAKHFETLLCQACKYLSSEQIDSLRNRSGIYDGLMWYTQHLFLDYCSNKDDDERGLSLYELHRLGYDVVHGEGYSELVKER